MKFTVEYEYNTNKTVFIIATLHDDTTDDQVAFTVDQQGNILGNKKEIHELFPAIIVQSMVMTALTMIEA